MVLNLLECINRLYKPGLLKLVLLLLFLVNLGTIQLFQWAQDQTATGLSPEEQREATRVIYEATEEKIEKAKELVASGQVYDPYKYFDDMFEIFKLSHEIGFRGKNTNNGHSLFVTMEKSVNSSRVCKAHKMNAMTAAARIFRYKIDAGRHLESDRSRLGRHHVWTFLMYMLGQYLKNLPLALVLFLIWFREEQMYREVYTGTIIVFRNPVRFSLMTLMYPIIIIQVLHRWGKIKGERLILEAEVRRTKECIFGPLDSNEISLIEKFLKNGLSPRKFRGYLRIRGLVFRHNLAMALMVTLSLNLLFLVVPKLSEADYKVHVNAFLELEKFMGQNLARIHIVEVEHHDENSWDFNDIVSGLLDMYPRVVVRILNIVEITSSLGGCPRKIDHIPKNLSGLGPVYS